MGVSESASAVFVADYAAVFQAALRAAALAGMTVSHAQPATGGLRLQTSRSFASCGEDIELQIEQADQGRIVVDAKSTLLSGSDDWGKNSRNLEKLFGMLEVDLRRSQAAGHSPAPAAASPAAGATAAPSTPAGSPAAGLSAAGSPASGSPLGGSPVVATPADLSGSHDEPAGRTSRFVAWARSHATPLTVYADPDGGHGGFYWDGRGWADQGREEARSDASDPVWLTLFKDASAGQSRIEGGSGAGAR